MISQEENSLEKFPSPCLPLTPRGPHHQANYPSNYCANAAKASRLHSCLLFRLRPLAARGNSGGLRLLLLLLPLLPHSASVIPGLSVLVSKCVLCWCVRDTKTAQNNDIFMIVLNRTPWLVLYWCVATNNHFTF